MHIFINGLGASAGGGLTYLANVLPHLSNAGIRTTVAVSGEFPQPPGTDQRIEYIRIPSAGSVALRFAREQRGLPEIIRRCRANVLISAGNFALRNSPVSQILLSRNSLYTSSDFSRDLLARGEYRMWIENRIKSVLAKRSINWADITIAPSVAFARDLETWTGRPVTALHHGFDREFFTASPKELPANIIQKLDTPQGALRVLLVSHYNYFRNFETVFRAIAKFKQQPGAPKIRLFLTCELQRSKTPGDYNPQSASRLIDRLGIREQVIELGAVPYQQLHHLYRACHIYVTAAYTETFAHPLVEAMSCGLPVVASDLPVHHEICGNAALYFPPFAVDDFAEQLLWLAQSPPLRKSFAFVGRERSQAFSWGSHVDELLRIAEQLLEASCTRNQAKSRSMSAA